MFIFQAGFLFLVALSLLASFRHFKSDTSVEFGGKSGNHQSLFSKVSSHIPSPNAESPPRISFTWAESYPRDSPAEAECHS